MNFITNSREEWLNNRRKGIGGSDIAAIVGLDPFRSAYDVYLDKIGEAEPVEDNDFMKWGRLLEPLVANQVAELGYHVELMPDSIVGENPHYLASVDRAIIVDGVKYPLEIKTSKKYHSEPLDKWKLQAAWYAAIMKAPGYYIAWWCYPTLKLEYFDLDQELAAMLFDEADAFWSRVLDRNPPESTSNFVASQGLTMEASDYLASEVEKLSMLKERKAEIEAEIETIEEGVKLAVKEAEILTHSGKMLLTYKEQKGRATIDTKALKAAHPDIASQFIKQGENYRVLRLKS